MKKSKLKAKLEELEFKNSQLLKDNASLIKDKLELKEEIKTLIETPDSIESVNIKSRYFFNKRMNQDFTRLVMFGSTNTTVFGSGILKQAE